MSITNRPYISQLPQKSIQQSKGHRKPMRKETLGGRWMWSKCMHTCMKSSKKERQCWEITPLPFIFKCFLMNIQSMSLLHLRGRGDGNRSTGGSQTLGG